VVFANYTIYLNISILLEMYDLHFYNIIYSIISQEFLFLLLNGTMYYCYYLLFFTNILFCVWDCLSDYL